ncbi:MAG TPA: hypothetical protein VMU45_13790 [Candidatus Eisenbacteria bacterium]|nr:hypothetical protein [Candidatus Eisenbacteria bacterium]
MTSGRFLRLKPQYGDTAAEATEVGVAGDESGFKLQSKGGRESVDMVEAVSGFHLGGLTTLLYSRLYDLHGQRLNYAHQLLRAIMPLSAKHESVHLSEIDGGHEDLHSLTRSLDEQGRYLWARRLVLQEDPEGA